MDGLCLEARMQSRLEYARAELGAALDFWREFHNVGSRVRLRAAIVEYRAIDGDLDGYESWASQLGKDRARGLEA